MHQKRWLWAAILAVLAAALVMVNAGMNTPTVQAQEGSDTAFTIEETTFESHYPRGMVFTVKAESDAGEIERATLFLELRAGTRERHQGEFDSDLGAWVAEPYADGGGIPPWLEFQATWLLTDSEGSSFETAPELVVYEDNTREWQSIDTEDITLYWFGFSEDGEFGELVAETMEAMRPLWAEGWGDNLSYKPIAIFFPAGDAWDEFRSGGNNPRAAGFTNSGWGYSLQRLASEEPPEFLMECVERWDLSTERDMEWRLERGAATIVHEFTHLYQSDFRVGGPPWWIEGQADYFAWLTGLDSDPADRLARLRSVTDDFTTLQGDGPELGVATLAADSCNGIGYDMGNHFIHWVLDNYGGLETHQLIVEGMNRREGLPNVLETVTGVPFVELENQWRATWNLGPAAPPPTMPPIILPTAPAFGTPPSSGS